MNFTYLKKPLYVPDTSKGDPYVTLLAEWIKPFEKEKDDKTELALIGIPLSKSSISFSGAHLHPESFRKIWRSFTTYNIDSDIELSTINAHDFGDVSMHTTDIIECHKRIEKTSFEITKHFPKTVPVFIGGDHSITYPILSGIKKASKKRIGVIHFDAHLDVRDTNYGGNSNGTPFRSLLESNVVKGEDVFTIGIRNFANSKIYYDYAKEKGVNIYTSKKVKEIGIQNIIIEALKHIKEHCDGFYITCDIDVLDQSIVPGVPAIGPGGLHTQEVFDSLEYLAKQKNIIGFDMVCVDPTQDLRDVTSRISLHAFLQFSTGIAQKNLD